MPGFFAIRVFLWIVLTGVSVFLSAGCASSPTAGSGVTNGALAPCPSSPNCICSETPGTSGYVAPLVFTEDPVLAWTGIQASVAAIGGDIKRVDNNYLWATFTSRIFHFTDDLELRMSPERQVIHVRSASRIGYLDFGVNAARVQALRVDFSRRLSGDRTAHP